MALFIIGEISFTVNAQADAEAIKYAVDCGICVIASSHTEREENLMKLPFEYYVKLTGVGPRRLPKFHFSRQKQVRYICVFFRLL